MEVIEARWLFNAQASQIEVVVHPQSVIHSMVEYIDGSVLAQLGNPDMRTPIAYGLGFPDRLSSGVGTLDLIKTARLDFCAPDMTRFPCLRLAYEDLNAGGTAPAILNAANEVAVASVSYTHLDVYKRQVRDLVKYCLTLKVEHLTLFAFSSENWRRPSEEVSRCV